MSDNVVTPPAIAAPKGKKLWPWTLGSAILAFAMGVAGILVGGRLPMAGPASAAELPVTGEDLLQATLDLGPIVLDVRDESGGVHHLKVGVAVELREGISLEEAKRYSPRGREAVIVCLRSKPFERLTSPKHFDEVRNELNLRVVEAFGKERIHRMRITDYISQ